MLNETFSVTEDRFGGHVVIGLRPRGATQDATEANQEEYVDLVVAHRILAWASRGAFPRVHGGAQGRAAARSATHV